MTDFGEFDRAEQLVRSFPTDEVQSAGLAAIAEGLVANGALDRAEQMLHAIPDPPRQRRPRLELLRVLLAQGKYGRAVDLARSAAIPEHRAAALTFVAGTTRRPDLLDEAVGIAEEVTEPGARMAILLSALQSAANLGDRPRTTALWEQIRATMPIGQHSTNTRGSVTLLHSFPQKLRTLTEIAEFVDRKLGISHLEDPPNPSVAGSELLWRQGRDVPKHVRLAYDLSMHDWFDLVDQLVEVEPDTFRAVVSELDRLGNRGTFHPLNLQ